jgi:lipopolysaccharide export LptBFGC system permease protein LptF
MVVSLSRKHLRSGRSFVAPLLAIVFLLACYILLAQWEDLPSLISAGLAAVHWPA